MSDLLTAELVVRYLQNADANDPLLRFTPPKLSDATVTRTLMRRVAIGDSSTYTDVSFGALGMARLAVVVNRSAEHALEAQWSYYSERDFEADLEPIHINVQGILPTSYLVLSNINLSEGGGVPLGLRREYNVTSEILADVLIVSA